MADKEVRYVQETERITQTVLGLTEPPRLSKVGQLVVERVLASLTLREETVLRLRCHRTLASVGEYFLVTRVRIAQIEAKAWRKLRHPVRVKYFRSACDPDLVRMPDYGLFGGMPDGLVGWHDWHAGNLWLPIALITLSIRAHNAVRVKGVRHVWELVRLSRRELLLMKNVGPKTVEEIEEELGNLGFRLGMELGMVPPPRPRRNIRGAAESF